MKKLLPLLLVTLLFASCQSAWNKEEHAALHEACMDDTKTWLKDPTKAKPYCDCVTEKLIARYPKIKDALEHVAPLSGDPEMQACKSEALR